MIYIYTFKNILKTYYIISYYVSNILTNALTKTFTDRHWLAPRFRAALSARSRCAMLRLGFIFAALRRAINGGRQGVRQGVRKGILKAVRKVVHEI